jgi:glutamate racemase
MSPSSPIVVLDSGLGGLTVARAIRSALPQENLVYFGDTARVPYGSKSAETVSGFVREIITYLRPHGPKHVVVACNTATALALPALRKEFADLSISGVIEPGARAAAEAAGAKEHPVIAVIATEATIRSRAYEFAIYKRRSHARMMFRPTPLLVPIIEEGRTDDDPVVKLVLKQYLLPLHRRGMDVLVLGCTHYPILKDLIRRMVGPKVAVVDSAAACAEDVARRLRAAGLLCGSRQGERSGTGTLRCFVTDNTPRFAALASRFLGEAIEEPTWVALEELHRGRVDDGPRELRVPA